MSKTLKTKLERELAILLDVAAEGFLEYNKALARYDDLDANYWGGGLDVLKDVIANLEEILNNE